jgi:lipopolysaccharide/colanic/teichoic acid biosynthesis glycosyltransferase
MSDSNRPRPAGNGLRPSPARRALDIIVAAVLLVILTPFIAVIAVLILVLMGRPVFFTQVRVGERGRRFALHKLRTMRVVAAGPEVTAQGDARITRLGSLLRRTSFDELPQLWHVLRGQMTLVGPRPESDALAVRYPLSCRSVLMVRPGLTGPAQLRYRERSAVPPAAWTDVDSWYLQVLVPLRVAADLEYLRRPTIRETVHYLLLTALFVLGITDLQRPVAASAGTTQTASDAAS